MLPETAPRGISHLVLNWLVVAVCAAGVVLGMMILLSTGFTSVVAGRAVVHFTVSPALVNLAVAVLSLHIALPPARRKQKRWTPLLLLVAAVLALVGLCASLLVRDDYLGGSCGPFDWPSGPLHAGYPYSWLDGHICVPPGKALADYARQNPSKATWRPDLLALGVDLSFWANMGILAASIPGLWMRKSKKTEMK